LLYATFSHWHFESNPKPTHIELKHYGILIPFLYPGAEWHPSVLVSGKKQVMKAYHGFFIRKEP
jgi:hypothetical protein